MRDFLGVYDDLKRGKIGPHCIAVFSLWVQGWTTTAITAVAVVADSKESVKTCSSSSGNPPLQFGMLPPVSLVKDAGLVGIKSSFGRKLELCYGFLDVVAQHLGGPCVCKGGENVHGGLALVDPVPVQCDCQ